MEDLCSVCRDIIHCPRFHSNRDSFIGPTYYPHHKTILGLKQAVDQGCPLCRALWRSLTIQDRNTLYSDSPTTPTPLPIISYKLVALKGWVGRKGREGRKNLLSIDFRVRTPVNNYIAKSFSFPPVGKESIQ